MMAKSETAAQTSEKEVAENKENPVADENKNSSAPVDAAPVVPAPEPVEPVNVDGLAQQVAEKALDAVKDQLGDVIKAEAIAAFGAILNDPATADAARDAAIDANARAAAEAQEKADKERAAQAKEAEKADKAAAKARAKALADARDDYELARDFKADRAAVVAEIAQGDGTGRLRFADGDSFLPAFDRTVQLSDFVIENGRAIYQVHVGFAQDAPSGLVKEAWLMNADGVEGIKCDLGVGLRVGAGSGGRIPAGHLAF